MKVKTRGTVAGERMELLEARRMLALTAELLHDTNTLQETGNGTGPILKTDEGDGTISLLKDAIFEQSHRIGPVSFSLPVPFSLPGNFNVGAFPPPPATSGIANSSTHSGTFPAAIGLHLQTRKISKYNIRKASQEVARVHSRRNEDHLAKHGRIISSH